MLEVEKLTIFFGTREGRSPKEKTKQLIKKLKNKKYQARKKNPLKYKRKKLFWPIGRLTNDEALEILDSIISDLFILMYRFLKKYKKI